MFLGYRKKTKQEQDSTSASGLQTPNLFNLSGTNDDCFSLASKFITQANMRFNQSE